MPKSAKKPAYLPPHFVDLTANGTLAELNLLVKIDHGVDEKFLQAPHLASSHVLLAEG